MAVEDAKKAGYLKDTDVRFFWRNSRCNGKVAIGVVADLQFGEKVDAYIGLPCSNAALDAGKLISYWSLPYISFSSVDPLLADQGVYSTLVRLMSPHNHLAEAMLYLFHFYGWKTIVIMSNRVANVDIRCEGFETALLDVFGVSNITVELLPRSSIYKTTMSTWVKRTQRVGRIVVMCGDKHFLTEFMLTAHKLGMTSGDYVFINPTVRLEQDLEDHWRDITATKNIPTDAFWPLVQISPNVQLNRQLIESVPHKMARPPWNNTYILEHKIEASPFAPFLYDSVWLYIIAMEEMQQRGFSPRNGSVFVETAKHMSFYGKSGFVFFDNVGDRVENCTLWQLKKGSITFTRMLEVRLTKSTTPLLVNQSKTRMVLQGIAVNEERMWGKTGAKPPPDKPVCGFYNELCPDDNSVRDITIGASFAAFIIIAVPSIILGVSLYRKWKLQAELDLTLWKINCDELSFIGHSPSGSRNTSKSTVTVTDTDVERTCCGFDLALYRTDVVAVRKLCASPLKIMHNVQLELKFMCSVNHDNLNTFIGICTRADIHTTVTKFCSKGSLHDILENDNITLDNNFKVSLLSDLIRGMHFLHQSEIKYHGRLRSSKCVIDGRWVLQITDWGIPYLRTHEYESEEARNRALLWSAPEVLRSHEDYVDTPKADVYSFGIILHETMFRKSPYDTEGDMATPPEDVIARVQYGERPPYRPRIPVPNEQKTDVVDLMMDCWQEKPNDRPDFTEIKNRFKDMNKGVKCNIVDNMLRMMEKYSNDLEEIVDSRTKRLTEEIKKTDTLLYRMMPPTVADCMKQGQQYQPEHFKHATIYFSDIVSFTKLAGAATPLQVVDFLNELWSAFDDIIIKYDVYKVETIGDGYLVASGLPVPNVERHAVEIALMALDVLSTVMAFTVRHEPERKLEIRIGLHSGPVVTGVVGHTMPRYCLFGDTVNIASRMESNGKPMRIHISQQTRDAIYEEDDTFIVKTRGQVQLKGKGNVTAYWLEGRHGFPRPLPTFDD